MEHAVPEQFWVDKSQCRYTDETGTIKNPTQADCAQGVSAVKAIAIAQAEGQRIYTINQSNAATALPKLPVGGTVGQEIQSAIQAGKEVTFHERAINAHGFSGYGYIITDPDTGGGAYLIEGKGNGGILILVGLVVMLVALVGFLAVGAAGVGLLMASGGLAWFVLFSLTFVIGLSLVIAGLSLALENQRLCNFFLNIATGVIGGILGLMGVGSAGGMAVVGAIFGAILSDATSNTCSTGT